MEDIRFKDFLIDYLEYNNISNKDFANRIGITPKHLIDILDGTRDLSSSVIINISIVTNIPIEYIYSIETSYKIKKNIKEFLSKNNLSITQFINKFNYQYLIKEKWINFIEETNKYEIAKDILKFLRISSPEKIYEIDNGILYKSKNNKPELLALWLEACYRETLNQDVEEYSKENLNIIIAYIKNAALEGKFDEKKLIEVFNKNGIYLVIHEDIPGAKIRGAFKVHKDKPAIYITYKYKRIADIYFTLLHELAHCKSDFNKAKHESIITLDEKQDKDVLELKADEQAYEWMIPNDYLMKFESKEIDFEEDNVYPKSFVMYRLADKHPSLYKTKKYQKYNFIVKKD